MSDANSLKPCPFCGSTRAPLIASSYEEHDEDRMHSEAFTVICSATTDAAGQPAGGCGSCGGWEETRAEAAAAWNRRAADEAHAAEIETLEQEARQMRARMERLSAALERIDQTLTIPAAEYVPAIGDVFEIIREARRP